VIERSFKTIFEFAGFGLLAHEIIRYRTPNIFRLTLIEPSSSLDKLVVNSTGQKVVGKFLEEKPQKV
jgi:hypothetical protein